MSTRLKNARILMYSHDTFGLGHLRRCRTIAHALVDDFSGLQVLIISGAQIAGAFDYRSRVDFVKIPSVIKLRNGEYTSMARHVDLTETLRMRRSIILDTAKSFAPDIFIVDKEPMGLHGEVEETLGYLKAQGTRLVLGLRDIMDSPRLLATEWARRGNLPKIETYYDNIWVYGPRNFYNPLVGLPVSETVRDRMSFVGFLKRRLREAARHAPRSRDPYILVTSGGGGDGADMTRDVIEAYRSAPDLPRAVIVLGPYMPAEQRADMMDRARGLDMLELIDFAPKMEELMAGAMAVVCMGGYNTWCEVLSFDKPALIVPRTVPREEQLIRADRAAELSLATMLMPEEAADRERMVTALRALPKLPPPSKSGRCPELDGLPTISGIVGGWLSHKRVAMPMRLLSPSLTRKQG